MESIVIFNTKSDTLLRTITWFLLTFDFLFNLHQSLTLSFVVSLVEHVIHTRFLPLQVSTDELKDRATKSN